MLANRTRVIDDTLDDSIQRSLTRRRNSLLYEVRKLKREGKVKKFFTDYDGSISIKRSVDGPKIKITSITKDPKDKKNTDIKSFTIAELRDLVNE